MCDFCNYEEEAQKIGCSLTIADENGDITTIEKHESKYYDHELCQYAQWFKSLIHAMGYEWVDEVKIVSHGHGDWEDEDKEFSSKDL